MTSQYWRPGSDRDDNDSIPLQLRFSRLPITHQRTLLPISAHRNEILYALEKFRVVIIVGETGTGKSTQIPQYLYESGWTRLCNGSNSSSESKSVVCTQPRRVAAVNVSTRVAEEMGCQLGETVGYNVRFHTKMSEKTVIKYCTDGVLLRETLSDPFLSKYSVVMIDEAHERSLQSDLLLGILKKIIKKRSDLRLIITSATINADTLCNYFVDAPVDLITGNIASSSIESNQYPTNEFVHVLSIQGRLHKVDIQYLARPVSNYIRGAVDTILSIHKSQKNILGDILVFLPGIEEINRAIELLSQRLEESHSGQGLATGSKEAFMLGDLIILPLHSSLPTSAQMAVFEATPSNKRKVILATNIAETSVTIEGIGYVVDSGFVKLNYFDVETNVEYLVTCPISKASASQRAGRAGRTTNGVCYRLYTEETFTTDLISFTPAEMQRVDISWAILQLKALGVSNILRFDYLSPPSSEHVIYALEYLYSLGAIDIDGNITLLGEKISEMSIDISLAKCLISSYDLGCSEEMLSIAAMCSVEFPFHSPGSSSEAKRKYWENIGDFVAKEGDHLTLLNIFNQYSENSSSTLKSFCDSKNLNFRIMQRAKEIRSHLQHMLIFYLKDYLNKQVSAKGVGSEEMTMTYTEKDIALASCGTDTVPIRKCLVSGYFSHAAKLSSDGYYRTVRGNTRVTPHSSSILAHYGAYPEWIIFHQAYYTKDITQIREVTKIDPMWLLELAPHYYKVTK